MTHSDADGAAISARMADMRAMIAGLQAMMTSSGCPGPSADAGDPRPPPTTAEGTPNHGAIDYSSNRRTAPFRHNGFITDTATMSGGERMTVQLCRKAPDLMPITADAAKAPQVGTAS